MNESIDDPFIDNDHSRISNGVSKNFTKNIENIKAFSEKLPKEITLPVVPTDGALWGLFEHDVTGAELNNLTENIQTMMIEQNKVIVDTIKEFNTIYNTFSVLDKEYIQGIVVSLKAAEKANERALEGIDGVKVNQNEIKQIINQNGQVIQVLKKFKEKLEKIEHLADVDKIFEIFSTIESKTKAIEAISNENKMNIEVLNREATIYGKDIEDLKRLVREDIQSLSEKVVQNNIELDSKIDLTANEVVKSKIDYEKSIKEFQVRIERHEASISAYFESELSKTQNEIKASNHLIESLSKGLAVTKAVSFVSVGITCALVIFIISRVL